MEFLGNETRARMARVPPGGKDIMEVRVDTTDSGPIKKFIRESGKVEGLVERVRQEKEEEEEPEEVAAEVVAEEDADDGADNADDDTPVDAAPAELVAQD